MNKAGTLFAAAVLLGACGVGDPEGPPAETDDRDEKLGIICNAELALTGTFAPGTPGRPAETPTGCWPVGTWTFTASMRTNECETTPAQLATTYSFRVDRVEDTSTTGNGGYDETYTWLGTGQAFRLKVSEGGGGECEGGLELYNSTGTEWWNFKPSQKGTQITGFAEYALYDSDQRNGTPGEL